MSRWNRLNRASYGYANFKHGYERTSSQLTMIRVLQYLEKNSTEDAPGFTQNHLMNIREIPTQNWTRFAKMLKHLVNVGLVEQSYNHFKITQEGQELVRSGLHLLDNASEQKSSSPA